MGPRIALCHEWVTTYGGSEQVASRIATALEVEDVFTYVAEPALAERLFPGRTVHVASRLGSTRFARQRWQWLLPFMSGAWRRLDLDRFDTVVTSSHSAVNSIRVRGRHVSYCHTPMRYAWQWREESRRVPFLLRPFWPVAALLLRASDRRRAQNVDVFVANSTNVGRRIEALYGRPASVVYPPIDTDLWTPGKGPRDDYYLHVGRLVSYKRVDNVILAAKQAGVRLTVAGDGPELGRLKRLAEGGTIDFVVGASDEQLRDLYRNARALVFAGVEDFGMTFVEAQACGTPVVALGRGGALEAVVNGRTGLLFEDDTVSALARILSDFDPDDYDRSDIRTHAERFGLARFDEEMRAIVSAI